MLLSVHHSRPILTPPTRPCHLLRHFQDSSPFGISTKSVALNCSHVGLNYLSQAVTYASDHRHVLSSSPETFSSRAETHLRFEYGFEHSLEIGMRLKRDIHTLSCI